MHIKFAMPCQEAFDTSDFVSIREHKLRQWFKLNIPFLSETQNNALQLKTCSLRTFIGYQKELNIKYIFK